MGHHLRSPGAAAREQPHPARLRRTVRRRRLERVPVDNRQPGVTERGAQVRVGARPGHDKDLHAGPRRRPHGSHGSGVVLDDDGRGTGQVQRRQVAPRRDPVTQEETVSGASRSTSRSGSGAAHAAWSCSRKSSTSEIVRICRSSGASKFSSLPDLVLDPQRQLGEVEGAEADRFQVGRVVGRQLLALGLHDLGHHRPELLAAQRAHSSPLDRWWVRVGASVSLPTHSPAPGRRRERPDTSRRRVRPIAEVPEEPHAAAGYRRRQRRPAALAQPPRRAGGQPHPARDHRGGARDLVGVDHDPRRPRRLRLRPPRRPERRRHLLRHRPRDEVGDGGATTSTTTGLGERGELLPAWVQIQREAKRLAFGDSRPATSSRARCWTPTRRSGG